MKYGLQALNPTRELSFLAREDATGGGNTGEQITFKNQEDLDALIQKRLDRQKTALKDELKDEVRESVRKELKEEVDAEVSGDFQKKFEAEQAKVIKLQETIDDFKAKEKEAEALELRKAVAKKHNIPEEMADRLKGESEEDLVADAKSLVKTLNLKEKPVEGEQKPKVPNTDVGLRPKAPVKPEGTTTKPNASYAFVKEGDVAWG